MPPAPGSTAVNAALGAPSRMIGGTKGSHILLDHDELVRTLHGRMIYFEADDGRICLVYDYLGRALVGSTDIPADDPDDVRCDDAEIDYFLDSLRTLLPGLAFDRDQIVYAYSGIRPLPASDASTPGLISRDHSAPGRRARRRDRPFPIVSLVGGKWTTFRGFAEEVADTRPRPPRPRPHRSTRDAADRRRPGFPSRRASAPAGWPKPRARPACPTPPRRAAVALRHHRARRSPATGAHRRGPPAGLRRLQPARRSTGSCATSGSCISPTSSCAARRSPSPAP